MLRPGADFKKQYPTEEKLASHDEKRVLSKKITETMFAILGSSQTGSIVFSSDIYEFWFM